MTAWTTVRPARLQDDAALRAIDAATWTSSVSPAPPPEPDAPFFPRRSEPADHLVAEVDGHIVGYVTVAQGLPIPSHQHVLEIQGLAVLPGHQGRGLGRQLVEAAKDLAGARGARKLTLRVLGPNTGARRLYESCGFTVEGVLAGEFSLEGRDVDDVLMAVFLTSQT